MGWQDRDYARVSPRPTWSGQRRGWLIGGSIVTTLLAVNVIVYVLGALSPDLRVWLYSLGAMQAQAVVHGQVWRLLTAQYLHAGTGHLFINMLVLHFLGRSLERLWSPRKLFLVYTLCGLCGNLFYLILGARGIIHPQMPAVGASGCIYGLLGIVAVLFPSATVYVYFLFPIKMRTAAFIFGGIAILTIIQRGANYGGEACHLAGLVFGVWWAMKGDAWWSRILLRVPGQRGQRPFRPSPPRVRPRRPSSFTEKVGQRRADEEQIDRILKKVHDKGIMSLTPTEKTALHEATERQRQREAQSGRVDRL